MADFLKTFIEGEDILASDANSNNQFLLSKLSDNAAQVQNYVEGEVAAIKSNVASVQATLQGDIDELEKNTTTEIDAVYTNITPDLSAGVAVSSGFEAPANGWIIATLNSYDNYIKGYVDNVLVMQGTAAGLEGEAGSSTFFLIRKGQKLTFSRNGYSAKFYPYLGGQ